MNKFQKYNKSDKGKARKRKYRSRQSTEARSKPKQRTISNVEYSKYIYCVDIETSTADGHNNKGEVVPVSYMISACVSRLNTITHKIEHYGMCRTYDEMSDMFYEISNDSKKKTLVYIHNFAYEFDFYKNNVEFFFGNDNSQMFMKKHKPLQIIIKNLYIRCSLLLTASSVKKMGIKLSNRYNEDWHKLDYDYDKVRTPLTPLDQDEIEYNYKDCDIVLKYIDTYFLSIYNIDEMFNVIYTITSTARYIGRQINTDTALQQFIKFNKECLATDEIQLDMMYDAFIGGLVTSNPFYNQKVIENVASFDFASSYPYVMLFKYPYRFREDPEFKSLKLFDLFVKDKNFNKKSFFIATIKIKNLKMNAFKYPILSIHKCIGTQNVNSINGKVLNADEVIVTCTSLDFDLYRKFYDFTIDEIIRIDINEKYGNLSKYTLNTLNYLLKKKSEYKDYNNIIQDAIEYKTDYDFEDKEVSNLVNAMPDLLTQKAAMKDEYLRIKGLLNSIYGVNVQKPLNSNIEYDYEDFVYTEHCDDFEKYQNQKAPKTNLNVGVFICAYARYNLGTILYSMLNAGVPVIYTDTDSIKCVYNETYKPIVDKIVDDYNSKIIENDFGIGNFDFEHVYEKFCTNGNKSYITLRKGVIDATISGLPAASDVYTRLYHYCNDDFQTMIDKCYHFNTSIAPELVNKLTHKYGDSNILEDDPDVKSDLIHINIDGYDDYVYSGTLLESCSLTIRSIDDSRNHYVNAINLIRFYKIPYTYFINKYEIYLNDGEIAIDKIGTVSNIIIKKLKEASEYEI